MKQNVFNKLLIIYIFIIIPLISFSQSNYQYFVEFEWNEIKKNRISEDEFIEVLSFKDGVFQQYDDKVSLYYHSFPISEDVRVIKVEVIDPVYMPLNEKELEVVKNIPIREKISVDISHFKSRDKRLVKISFLPLIKKDDGQIYKLLQASLNPIMVPHYDTKSAVQTKQNSVLSSGDWYKIKLEEDGIYKLTYSKLKDWGVNLDNVDINKIGIFGNTGMMLPQMNNVPIIDDLEENPIMIEDGGDGIFNKGDYIAFYGKGPTYWKLNEDSTTYNHVINPYSDYSYYFFTPNAGTGKTMNILENPTNESNYFTNEYDDYRFHELEKVNLIKSGRNWYGELMSSNNRKVDLEFSFQNIVPNSDVSIKSQLAARSKNTTDLSVLVNGTEYYKHNFTSFSSHTFARQNTSDTVFSENGTTYNVTFKYNALDNLSKAWLDWVELTARSYLIYNDEPLFFRDKNSIGEEKITTFNISNAKSGMVIWDITNPVEPKKISSSINSDQLQFTINTPELKQFVTFELNNLKVPEFEEKVENQNLHALSNIDFVIVSPDIFKEQAIRVGEFHQEYDQLNYVVVNLETIYNEFSSGGQDVTALRNFFKCLYHKSDQYKKLRYVMFMGNASYDYKDRLEHNTLFVPTFQFQNSYSEVYSYISDDYFALLDEDEGYKQNSNGNEELIGVLDIGIGRVPAEDISQASRVVDKFIHYGKNKSRTKGSWKNEVCILSDDEDRGEGFVRYSEDLYDVYKNNFPTYNVNKIYIDAYEQISTSGGQRYPQVNDAIKAKMEKGLFVFSYIGHGGGLSLSDERIMTIPDIEGFTNYDAMPFFITSTCEFSRFDDPENVTAGERLLLNPNGGAISMITTSRVAYAYTSVNVNKRAVNALLAKNEDGEYPRLGDVIRASKAFSSKEIYNMVLLGDPALQLAYPDYGLETTEINGINPTQQIDTLSALEEVTVKGFIKDRNGNIVTDYNGILYPKLYDKKYLGKTRGQDPSSPIHEFEVQDNLLFQGKASVINGEFEFKFVLPKDIDYHYGNGRISYYASNDDIDASGFTEDFLIGGVSNSNISDNAGPDINLYLNNRDFEDGDVVSPSPLLLADLYDDSGINTSGSGVGHNISAILDDNIEKVYVVNDYYTTKIDTYKEGIIKFPLNGLDAGRHTLKLIAWDINNNSSEKELSFIVSNKIRPQINSILAVPNPFSNAGTDINIEHNLFGEFIISKIYIYDLMGRLIKVLGPYDMRSDGFSIEPIHWDGKDNQGNQVDSGVYVYSVEISNLKGFQSQKGGKIVKIK